MEYNTSRTKMIIPEYGRHIQKLINHAVEIEDDKERNEMVLAIVDVMGQLNPHLRDVADFTHKLWDHVYIMSDFKLKVDGPYPVPLKEQFEEKPRKMPYPDKNIRFKHYGRGVEKLIDKAIEMAEGEEKNALIESIANLMKKHYLNWSRNAVTDQQIFSDIKRISRGKIEVSEDIELIDSKEILSRNLVSNPNAGKARKKSKRKPYKSKKNY
tara:strand:- start:1077 stop:1712 length:636 start_codon:yes stop_codon:yes gene_type:complete